MLQLLLGLLLLCQLKFNLMRELLTSSFEASELSLTLSLKRGLLRASPERREGIF
jgi:hypothetical protein